MKHLLVCLTFLLLTFNVTADTAKMTQKYLEIINTYRLSIGLNALILDEDMSKVAYAHSHEMATGDAPFSHDGFGLRCSKSRKILGKGNLCGEIIANGQKTPERVFQAWMNSPGHRAKIEEARYTHTGFGPAKTESGKMYWTEIFMEMK